MASLLVHVYFLQNLLNKGVPSDDTRLSNRLVAHALKQSRSKLLKQKLDTSIRISESNYQIICVPLEQHTFHDCSCITDNNECLILRSTENIPKYMMGKMGSTLQARYLDGRNIPMISITSNELAEYSLTANNKIGYFMDAERFYILNNLKLREITLKAIWEDPEEVEDFNALTCDQVEDCPDVMSDEFPIDSELVYPMYQLSIDLLGYSYKFPEDTRNDGKAVEIVQSLDPNETRR